MSDEGQSGLPARRAAVTLLDAVLLKRQSLDAAFSAAIAHGSLRDLSPRDRALARAVAATGLRRKGQLDEIFHGLLERPLKGRVGSLPNIVLAAMTQILPLGMPVHAVVNLAVEQCKADRRTRHFSGLVNAVLRRAASQGPEIMSAQDAAKLNTPAWLYERWAAAWGADTAHRIAEAHLEEPPLDVSVKSDPEAWAARLSGLALETGSVRLRQKGRIEALPGFDEGSWWVQDMAAALPARLLGDVRGTSVADLCAAPGGKTAQLALAGARVVAVDISKPRMTRLASNLKRLGLTAERVTADASQWRRAEPFDAVLLDAPCSSTGTIRRHPDIAHVKGPEDIADLARVQARMLDHALTLVRPGGRLLYCTCSLEREEGEDQIAGLLGRVSGVGVDAIEAHEISGRADWLTPEGYLRTLPHFHDREDADRGGMDGFFAARLQVDDYAGS